MRQLGLCHWTEFSPEVEVRVPYQIRLHLKEMVDFPKCLYTIMVHHQNIVHIE